MTKAVDYIRVSSKEQEQKGYSPMAQKRLLWSFARENSFDMVKEFEHAETAKKAGRTAFNAMIEYVKENNIKHIIVEKTDRLYRNWKDYVVIEDLINDYDVTIHFVKENESLGRDSTPSRKFMHTIQTAQAKYFIDNLKEESKKGTVEKVRQGVFPYKARLGYLNIRDTLTHKAVIGVDENNRLLIQEMFRLYATGLYSLNGLIDKLEKMRLTTNMPAGRRLNKTTVAKYLADPLYVGRFKWGRDKKIYNGIHEPLIDMLTWQKVQEVLKLKNINKCKKHNVKVFPFKNILTCGECQRSITAEKKKGKYVYYKCTKYQRKCSQEPVKEELLNECASSFLPCMAISDLGVEYAVAGLKASLEHKRATSDKTYESLTRERTTLKNRLDRMYEDRLDGKISEQYYNSKEQEYNQRLEVIDIEMKAYDKADANYYDLGIKILELAQKAQTLYQMAEPDEKQELLHYLLSNSTLKDQKPNFKLKKPFKRIAETAQNESRKSLQGRKESNPR